MADASHPSRLSWGLPRHHGSFMFHGTRGVRVWGAGLARGIGFLVMTSLRAVSDLVRNGPVDTPYPSY
jgi:hypothetical protein